MEEILDEEFSKIPENNRPTKTMKVLVFILMLSCILAVLLSWVNVESIIFTGPACSVFGIVISILSKNWGTRNTLFIGIFPLVVSLGCALIINILMWSPSDAQQPISTIITIATFILSGPAFLVFKKQPKEL